MGDISQLRVVFIACVLFINSNYVNSEEVDLSAIRNLSIFMPTNVASERDAYVCQALPLNPTLEYYVVSYTVQATMDHLHHLMLFGCTGENPHTSDHWPCNGMKSDSHDNPQNEILTKPLETRTPCDQSQLLYAWTRNGPGLDLPPNSSFTIGGGSDVQYLVLQAHYNSPDNPISQKRGLEEPIRTGVILHYTLIPQPRVVGILIIGAVGKIEPESRKCWDAAWRIEEDVRLTPIYFAVHTHSLGTKVYGYRIRKDNWTGLDRWTLIGSKDPQAPQMPYPVKVELTIQKGDILALRCAFRSNRTVTTVNGDRNDDEMCNLYVMYWTERGSEIQDKYYFSEPFYAWNQSPPFFRVPEKVRNRYNEECVNE